MTITATLSDTVDTVSAQVDVACFLGWMSADLAHDLNALRIAADLLVRSDESNPSFASDDVIEALDSLRLGAPVNDIATAISSAPREDQAEVVRNSGRVHGPLRRRFLTTVAMLSLMLSASISMPAIAVGGIASVLGRR